MSTSNKITRAIADVRVETLDDEALRRTERVIEQARDALYIERRRRIVAALDAGGRPTDLARTWGVTRGRVYQMQSEQARDDA